MTDQTTTGWAVPDRLPTLGRGAHPAGSPQPCVMEAASWLAGESWSDHPRSVQPAVASVARWVNDAVDDATRQRLWPLIIASVGTGLYRRPVVAWRLRRAALSIVRRARTAGDPVRAWPEILERYSRLTGVAREGARGSWAPLPPDGVGEGGDGGEPVQGWVDPYALDGAFHPSPDANPTKAG